MKKIGFWKIRKKISKNAYVLELLKRLDISPTFNMLDLYEYHEGIMGEGEHINDWED